jgi:general secretion pathway protein D
MKTNRLILLFIALLPFSAFAQFDFGNMFGGGQQQRQPWEEFPLPNRTIRLDFRNANPDMILKLFQDTSGITIIKDPALNQPMTLTTARAVPLGEAFQALSTALSLRNFELRREGSFLVVRSRAQQGRGGQQQGRGGLPEGMDMRQIMEMMGGARTELRTYQLRYANAAQVARVVNEVFAQAQDPMSQIMQMFMGGMGGGNQQQRGRGGFQLPMRGGGNQSSVRASSDDYSNTVIVNAPAQQQTQVADLIRQIDRETEQPMASRVYRLEFAPASELAPLVQNVLTANAPRGRGGVGTQQIPFEQRIQQAARFGSSQAAFGTVVADTRTNALVVTATDENQRIVEQVIKELDTEVVLEASTFVIPLDNARADQVSQLLQQAFGNRAGGGFGQFGQRTGQFGQQQRTNQQQFRPQQQLGGGQRGGGMGGGGIRRSPDGDYDEDELQLMFEEGTNNLLTNIEVMQGLGGGFGGFGGQQRQPVGQTGRDAQGRLVNVQDLTGQVTVIPDPNTNSLIVVTSPENADLIRQILAQLDRIPEQVMIETIIVEATLDSSTRLGVEWQFVQDRPFGTPGTTGTAGQNFGLQTATPALQGFRYTLTGGSLTAFMNALQTDSRFQVLSTPRIFTSNNVQAQINISQRVPFVVSQRTDALGNVTFNYEFQDVGIVLTVTPRITAGGYVTMDVIQTANDLQGFTTFNAPIVNQRQANTTVAVRDGETIILGGIIRSQVTSTVRKIPLLGDIPLLGQLFRTTDRQNAKTELLVFLTPRVVRNPDEADELTRRQQDQLSPGVRRDLQRVVPPRTQGDQQNQQNQNQQNQNGDRSQSGG